MVTRDLWQRKPPCPRDQWVYCHKSLEAYYNQGRMNRRGHVTTIFHITNRRGRMSKNRQQFIARALYAPDALRLASVPGLFFLQLKLFP